MKHVNPESVDFKEIDFDRVVQTMRQLLFGVKEKEYNKVLMVHDYFIHGKKSYDQMLWVKCLREMNREEGDNKNDFDSLKDLIAYSMFAFDYAKKTEVKK